MQTVDGKERVVACASKLLVGSQRNWIRKTDGITEIECWGIVWATRKFRCYLDRTEFDLYTDHNALTWVFSPENRTSNAKLARWAMELSQLNFKVYHKPGPSLGHVDGLSRLRSASVCAITIDDLLNADEAQDESAPMISEGIEQPTVPGSESTYPAPSVSSASVGESPTHVLPTEPMTYPVNIPMAAPALAGEPSALTETSEEVGEGFEAEGPVDKMERSFTSVEEFGLNQEKIG
ncbi:unnamed protein product [Phytophthora fragariaefolia]|uniref:Unnamed protein product n=1 Tax=Phytophthora fragariaefolia TaxID=1490495 RepID=A0A9W6XRR7_9STRA|nr:unnamed protein product [Phytophthora fragariaefolia]